MNADTSLPAGKLATSFESGVPLFVLVDPVLGEPLPLQTFAPADIREVEIARGQAWQRDTHRVRLADQIDLPLPQHPYIVALHGQDDPWLAATLDISLDEHNRARAEGISGTGMTPMRIAGWLSSSMHADDLCASLGELMRAKTEAPTTARYLRLADRRVLDWLTVIVGPGRIGSAMGRIQRWAYIDVKAELTVLESDGQPTQELRLDRSQWAELMRGSLLHPTLARWTGESSASNTGNGMEAVSKDHLYRMAVGAVAHAAEMARKWPRFFKQPSDHTAWAALSLLYPGLGEEVAVQQQLSRDAAGDAASTVHALCFELDQIVRASRRSPREKNSS